MPETQSTVAPPAAPPLASLTRPPRVPARSRVVGENFTLLFEGGRNRSLFRVLDGCIVLSQLLDDGRRQITDVLGPGRLFGFTVEGRNIATAETLSIARIETLGDAELHATNPAVASELKTTLHRLQTHATLLGRKTASEKVASALVELSRLFNRSGRSGAPARLCFHLHLTRADLADWLGLTVETVSRCLNRFKREGLIDFSHPKSMRVLDPERLETAAGLTRQRTASGVQPQN
ncbi:helix-turn-helix domain-containing protein (plasmid) [Ensifer adhaerens]|uniref:Crp/Fnr family transcriptional regulator n=1 Tax=Ensifer adhaerens TaxID=106592 RepID=UPI0023A93F98|nr:helix-turn-helix domain-containing protein [Ensifer adhaerens]WDZ79919.1 helix-turn-helix domain-containing protein [Ensifer adhaerens]